MFKDVWRAWHGESAVDFDEHMILPPGLQTRVTLNLPTNIVDLGGFDSSIMSFFRGWILMSIGIFPESLSQAMLVGVMLVGRSGVAILRQDLPAAHRGQDLAGENNGRRC